MDLDFKLDVAPNVLMALAGVFTILLLASVIVAVLKARNPQKDYNELVLRVRSWWVMASIFSLAMIITRDLTLIFLGLVSFLALKEYLSIIPTRRADRRVLFWAYIAIPIQYYWIHEQWYGMFIIFVPVYLFLFIPFRMILIGETKNFLHAVGTIHWGVMTMVFSISHVAYLLALPDNKNPAAGGAGLVLFLIFLTQFNDVAQYTWGKMLGKHKIVPKVSPNKTWQGFLGGVITTTILAVLLAPVLTPMDLKLAITAGLIISIGGFIGDVTVS
ncbi:MAG: phosphatidate cytidylyltransferase, partial [Gammaproteobacteria bacterium]|nr:phosphatidate cytidylyltransferase [Gammaproteobacteria bacterium]